MISYIQAIDVIRAFAIQHLQVKKFNYEFKEQMQNLATLNEAYPFLYVVPIGASVQEFTNEFDLDIYCVDRLQKDRTNTSFIVSDTQQILADLTLWLEQGQNDIEVIQNYAMTPINNDLLDYVSGWVMRVRIQVTRIGLCEIPFGGESPTPPTCPSGIVKNSDDTYTEIVPSSGTLVLDDITVTDSDGTEIQVPAQTDFVCIPCDPPTEIDVYINRELVAENATEDVRLGLVDQDGNIITFTQVDDTLTVNIPPCEDATVENSDNSYSDTISSGGTLVLPDITVTDSDGSTYTQPAVTDVVCTIPDPCEDATLTLNGNPFLSVPSGDTQDIELLDQNGDPITPDDVTGNVITVDVGGGECVPTYLFDFYGGASFGYSVRRLSTYATYSMRVRRSSDNTELNIGFIGEDLDTASLLSFVGSSSAYVVIWYDQSGNENHARQTSASNQPRIVNAGVIEELNGTIAVRATGGNNYMSLDVRVNEIDNTKISVGQGVTGGSDYLIFGGNDLNGVNKPTLMRLSGALYYINNGSFMIDGTSFTNVQCVLVGTHTPSESQLRRNATLVANSRSALTTDIFIDEIMTYVAGSRLFSDANFQEIIHFSNSKSAVISGIETNINNYYAIY